MLNAVEVAKSQRALQLRKCPECGSTEWITDQGSGEVVCKTCGLVISDVILDQKPEWRAFTLEERRSKARTGAPTSLNQFDKGLSTTFQPYKDAYGRALPLKDRLKMIRLRRWNLRSRMHSSVQRNLSQAMNVLTRLSDKLHVPRSVAEHAALIYRKALDKGLIRGRSIKSIAAAALYAACRITRTPRPLKDVVRASTRSRKEISRNYRLIRRELNLTMPVDYPAKYVPKIVSKAGLSQKTGTLAIELLQKAKEMKVIVGKGPVGIAAAALYIASFMNGEAITQRKLARVAGVTEVTVRNRYKGLNKHLGLGLRKGVRR